MLIFEGNLPPLDNVWRSFDLSSNTKIVISNTIVKPDLLYGAETCRISITTTKKTPDIRQHLPQKDYQD